MAQAQTGNRVVLPIIFKDASPTPTPVIAWHPVQVVPVSRSHPQLMGVSAAAPAAVWAVGQVGFAARSTDGGETWQSLNTGTSADLAQVAASSADVAWALANPAAVPYQNYVPFVIRTTDGGGTWSTKLQGTAFAPSSLFTGIAAPSVTTAWVVGRTDGAYAQIVAKSTDGGTTWTRQALPHDGTLVPSGIVAVDEATAWLAATHTSTEGRSTLLVFRTTDGGATWAKILERAESGSGALAALSAASAWVATSNYQLLVTTDGGATWRDVRPAIIAPPALTASIGLVDASWAWVTVGGGSPGTEGIYETRDGGTAWSRVYTAFVGATAARPGPAGWATESGGRVAVYGPVRTT
jgi:photosystem II stability/assembly factor-like uncharacterized protein